MYCAVPENITIVIVKTSYPLPTNGIKNSRGMGDSSRPKKKIPSMGGIFCKVLQYTFLPRCTTSWQDLELKI